MKNHQNTISETCSISGHGLHTGVTTKITFKPAPSNTGLCFIRTDLEGKPKIKAHLSNFFETKRSTLLKKDNASIQTTEHVLAAAKGLDLDNLYIEIDGPEVPILDGSSIQFLQILKKAGISKQNSAKKVFKITSPHHFIDKNTGSEYFIEPHERLAIEVNIDYKSKTLKKSGAKLESMSNFESEIADSRTFVFLKEILPLLDNNLIKGGSLDCAIVFSEEEVNHKELLKLAEIFGDKYKYNNHNGILNNTTLKYDNEPARHKLLDVIGDLALLNCNIQGRLVINKPGHKSNIAFAKKLNELMKKSIPIYNPNQPAVKDIHQIMEMLPHRPPFLLIDKIMDLDETSVVGVKNVTINEDFFKGHFPGEAVMPGVLQVEAMAQTGGILILNTVEDPENYLTYFMKIDKVKFKQKVVPGDTLVFSCELMSPIRRGICHMFGKAYVGEKLVMEAELMAQIKKVK